MRVLIVEDEKDIAKFLKKVLEKEAHAVDLAYDGISGERLGLTEPYDLIVLDIMLPGKKGIELLTTLRKEKIQTPILILTALGEVPDRVRGLDAGADDYLVKPFAVAELLARVRALLRRNSSEKNPKLSCGDIIINPETRVVKVKKIEIELTAKEYAILEFLIRNKNRLLSKGMISEHVWDFHFSSDLNLIEVYVRRLRNKIQETGSTTLINTVRNGGYIIRDNLK